MYSLMRVRKARPWSTRPPMLKGLPLLLAAATGGAGCAVLAWLGVAHPRTGLVTALCIVAPAPWWIRAYQRRWDVFEPIQIMAFGIVILFVWRPLWELSSSATPYPGYDSLAGFNGAMAIGLVGTLSVYIGYFCGAGNAIASRVTPLADHWDADRSIRFVRRLLWVGAILTALYAAQAGVHYLISTYSGRSSGNAALSSTSSGYFYQGPYLTIPSSFILLIAYSRKRSLGTLLLLVVTSTVALAITVPAGDRTFILELMLPLVVMWYLRRNRRPRIVSVVAVFLVFLMFANLELVFRNTSNRANQSLPAAVAQAVSHPAAELGKFIGGADPSEFTALEVEVYGFHTGELTYQPGSTVSSIFTGWIPHEFFPNNNKPLTPLQYATWTMFPSTRGGGSYGPSMFGSMFVDYGWITLTLFSLLVGIALRTLWEYFRAAPQTSGMQLLYAAALPLVIIMLRNDVDDIVYRSVFFLVPLILCIVTCSRPPRVARAFLARHRAAA